MPNQFGTLLAVLAMAMSPCAADDALVTATTAISAAIATSAGAVSTSSKTPDEQRYLDKTAMAQRLQLTAAKHAWGSCADICSSQGGTLATIRNVAGQEAAEELSGAGLRTCSAAA